MPIKKTGIILSGEYKGWKIKIDDNEGGWYIYLEGESTGYDEWYQNEEDLNQAIEEYEYEYIIKWDETPVI